MKRIGVVYQSRYGTTQKYAQWIAEALSGDLLERKQTKLSDLEPYDTIIYGGGLYAGGVLGIDLLIKNYEALGQKELILFTCGLADPLDKQNTDSIRESLNKVLTPAMQEKIKVFHFRGAIDYKRLGAVHKAMMAMLYRTMVKREPDSLKNEEKEMLATYGKVVDFTDQSSILPLVDYVQSPMQNHV